MKKNFILFGFVISILILMLIPQNSIATTMDIENGKQEDYELIPSKNEKGEWKTNYLCRIRARGVGNAYFYDFDGDIRFPNIWIGFAPSAGVNLGGDWFSFEISGVNGSDSSSEYDGVELEAKYFFGFIFIIKEAGWYTESAMYGFAIKCRYIFYDW